MTLLLPILCLFACLLTLVFEAKGMQNLTTKAKLAASLAFVGFAWEQGAAQSVYGQIILAGLVLSLAGDVLLSMQGKRWFLIGIAAFLLAHLCYSLAFYQTGFDTTKLPLVAPVVLLLMVIIGLWLRKHLTGIFQLAVPAYLLAIGLMLVMAWSNQAVHIWWWITAGASLFALSDVFVARQRFVQSNIQNRIIGLPIYYIAQLMLAYSVTGF